MSQVLPLAPPPASAPVRTFGSLRCEGERWVLDDVPPHVALRLKTIFPRIPKTQTGAFKFDDTPAACADLAWFIQRYPVVMEPQDGARLDGARAEFVRQAGEIESILLPTWRADAPAGFRDGKRPFIFQQRPMEIAARLGRLLTLDEGGLGKTITAIGTMLRADRWPAAAIVEPHLATQWRGKIKEFSNLRAHVIDGTLPYTLPPADVYVFRYSNIIGWTDVAARGVFKQVHFDEIQSLRHGITTGKGLAAKAFTERAELLAGYSATPIYNYGSEMFNVLDYIAPGALGTWDEFLREWCGPGPGKHWIVKDPDALGTYLREQNLALRRSYDDPEIVAELGEALPKPNIVPIEIEHDAKVEADAYDLCRQLAIKVISGTFVERGQASRQLNATVRRITGVAKARHAAAYVRMLLSEGESILLAGWHREVYDIWSGELAQYNPVLYTGSETTAGKDKAKADFLSGRSRVMFISLRSGAGLDGLQSVCNTLVFGELDYSPQVHEQVIWRLRRLGQARWPVNVFYLLSNGGSDPMTSSILGLKASQSRGITDPMAGIEHVLSDESRIRMIAQRYLEGGTA